MKTDGQSQANSGEMAMAMIRMIQVKNTFSFGMTAMYQSTAPQKTTSINSIAGF